LYKYDSVTDYILYVFSDFAVPQHIWLVVFGVKYIASYANFLITSYATPTPADAEGAKHVAYYCYFI